MIDLRYKDNHSKDLIEMPLHEIAFLSEYNILRVIGGWIYFGHGSSCFVPETYEETQVDGKSCTDPERFTGMIRSRQ